MEHAEEQEKQKTRGGACEFPYFERNNYYFGKLMTVRDFFAEQCYFNQKRWLINRMVNGWGVVCGLDVCEPDVRKSDPYGSSCVCNDSVIVTPGLAIDCLGREILVCDKQAVSLIPVEPDCSELTGKPEYSVQEKTSEDETLVICLEYNECKTETINMPPTGNCNQQERCEFNRIMDNFRILTRRKADVCTDHPHDKICPLYDKSKTIHEFLSEKLKTCPSCPECADKSKIPCLVLAEISIKDGKYNIDQSKRKLVYRNPLLYDLIDCFHGDLPHVININWPKPEEGPLPWNVFENMMTNVGVEVTFDKKMDEGTLNENTFLFMVKETERETGYFQYKCIPSNGFDFAKSDSQRTVATLKLDKRWLAEVFEGYSAIQEGAEFLVLLRSDHIMSMSENRKALDGNFIGGILPSGNGVQGGDFVSWFSVNAKEEAKEEKTSRKGPRSRESKV